MHLVYNAFNNDRNFLFLKEEFKFFLRNECTNSISIVFSLISLLKLCTYVLYTQRSETAPPPYMEN